MEPGADVTVPRGESNRNPRGAAALTAARAADPIANVMRPRRTSWLSFVAPLPAWLVLVGCAGSPNPAAPHDAATDAETDAGTDAAPDPATDAGTDAGTDTATDAATAETVAVTFRVIDAVTRRGVAGMLETGDGKPAQILVDGTVTVTLAAQRPFEVVVQAAGYAPLHLHGNTARGDFTLVSFAASRAVARGVLGALGITDDGTTGLVVAGLDTPSLRPAVGAAASVDGARGPAFIFDATGMPRIGDTLVAGGSSFVSVPGVATGEATVRAAAPTGQRCTLRESGGAMATITVQAGAVHVVSFTCAAMP